MGRSVICIGAGVIGMSSAYAMARRGWRVTLIDRENGPAMGTSHANGAQLSYCYTDALGSPAVMAQLPRLIRGKGGVSFGLGLAPDYLCWLAQFARNCTAARFRSNTLAVYALAQQSRLAMDALCHRHDLEFAHRAAGKVHLLYSEKEIRRADEVRAMKRALGCEQTIVPRADFGALDPALERLDSDVMAAISTPHEVVGDPLLFCHALLDVLNAHYGVEARFGCDVTAIEENRDGACVTLSSGERLDAGRIVIASGMDSNRLLKGIGRPQPIQPMKGYSFEMPAVDGSPNISVTDGKRRLVITNLGERIRVAGIAELGKGARDIDLERMNWLVRSAQECLPSGGDYAKAGGFWAGLRPATPNSQPIIRRVSEAVAINAGHGALGWTLAMGSGEKLAWLLDQ